MSGSSVVSFSATSFCTNNVRDDGAFFCVMKCVMSGEVMLYGMFATTL